MFAFVRLVAELLTSYPVTPRMNRRRESLNCLGELKVACRERAPSTTSKENIVERLRPCYFWSKIEWIADDHRSAGPTRSFRKGWRHDQSLCGVCAVRQRVGASLRGR